MGLIAPPAMTTGDSVGKAVFAVLSVWTGRQVSLAGGGEDGGWRVPLEALGTVC